MAKTTATARSSAETPSWFDTVFRPTDPRALERRSELIGVIVVALAGAFGAALWTYDAADMDLIYSGRGASDAVHNLIGPVGARIADLLLQLFGVFAYLLNGLLFMVGIRTVLGRSMIPRLGTVSGVVGAAVGAMLMVHLWARAIEIRPHGKDAAGLFGSAAAEFLRAFLSTAGTGIVALVLLASAASALSGRPLVRETLLKLAAHFGWLRTRVHTASEDAASQLSDWKERREARREIEESAKYEAVPAPIPDVFADELTTEHELSPAADEPVSEVFDGLDDDTNIDAKPRVFEDADGRLAVTPIERPPSRTKRRPSTADRRRSSTADQRLAIETPTDETRRAKRRTSRKSKPDIEGRQQIATRDGFPAGMTLRPKDMQVPTGVRRARARASQGDIEAADSLTATEPDTDGTLARAAADAARGAAVAAPASAPPTGRAPIEIKPIESDADNARPAVLGNDANRAAGAGMLPRIIATEAVMGTPRASIEPAEQGRLAIGRKSWRMPRKSMLQEIPEREIDLDTDVLTANAMTLMEKLADFGVKGSIADIRPGPVVTTYEFKPAKGVRVNTITRLRDDLTMSLAAENVRVVAPIPGKDVVGIEVPNEQRQIVYFREVVESNAWQRSKSPLTIVLGKDIEGAPIVADLAKAPHLLVAGATGQGKSVGVNSMICSMLYKATPEDVKFIFIDPKVIELSIYEGIPHLLLPVLSDPDKATLALKWAVREMERRYAILHDAQVRHIDGYRAKLPKLKLQAKTMKVRVRNGKKELVDMHEPGTEVLDHPAPPEDLPKICIVIDEFADLILNTGKDVEVAVSRLAAKARACGIHIILATQRPDTKVITGTIKANFPSRVAFKVSTKVDSGVVLDQSGAETLLGKGDMLFWPAGKDLVRCHGTFVTDDEVIAVANHWKEQGEPSYDLEILKDPEAEDIEVIADADLDKVFWDAVQIAQDAQQASVSFLQRKLKIGYQRSARIIDQMEARGIVGPSTGANRPREILDFTPHGPTASLR